MSGCSTLKHGDDEVENKQEDGNADEEEDEDEDVDFNPFLKETHSAEASSSLSSEVEDLDTDGDDRKDCCTADVEGDVEIMMQTNVSSIECGRISDITCATFAERESVSATEAENGLLRDKENRLTSLTDVTDATDSRKAMANMDTEGAICMRTRARYSLTSFTLDELETFLQETDDEDDLQNVDDEEEYRKFLAAVLQGDGSLNLQGNANGDDEDEENDADFELELEEALESDQDEIEERRMTRRNRCQKASVVRCKKNSGQSNRPLRPLLPFVPLVSFSTFEENQTTLSTAPSYMPPPNNGFTSGFSPHQIGQLHCLIHEHVQLLIQVFSVCVLDPAKGDIAADIKNLILEMLQKRDQVLAWRMHPLPSFCFFPPYIHPSVADEHVGSLRTLGCASWVPYICGPVLSVTDVAPLRLVGNFIDDVSSAVRSYKRNQIELGFETHCEKEPLFPFHNSPVSTESDGQGEIITCPQDSSEVLSSSSKNQMSKKTMAATLIEKSKKQSVALVPKEIAQIAQRFCQLFNPALYPRKPPPAPIANRVLFTVAEDELLALGLMEYNTDWKAIQQRFLPCKSSHQIFVRQKNRVSSKAPENPIKAVRRLKNSPLTSEEIARIEVGLKNYKLDWISIWRFFVPYRDPSLLPRQWRIACGTQKSYKSDANNKAKRRLYDLRRKTRKPPSSNCHSSSDREGDSTDNAVDDTNCGDIRMDKVDEAYVHEAFLADWRPDSNVSFNFPTHLSSQKDSQPSTQKDNSCSTDFQPQMRVKDPASVKLPYRTRKSKYARLVKLAPDLPPINLPPSVRIIPQSDFAKSQGIAASAKVSCNVSRNGGMLAENGVPRGGSTKQPEVDKSAKSGQSGKITAGDQRKKDIEVLSDTRVAVENANSDFQMHPLLFEAPQVGCLPYYPLDSSTNTLTFFSEKLPPRLNLSLFHNPRQIRDAVNFLSKSSKPTETHISSSSDIIFHPLLHDDVDKESIHPALKLPSDAELRKRDSPNPSCPVVSKLSGDDGSGTKVSSHSEKVNELDLDIRLSFNSKHQDAVEHRNMIFDCAGRLVRGPVSGTETSDSVAADSTKNKGSASDGTGNKLDSCDLPQVTSRSKRSRKVADNNIRDESLPGIIMEQEELSDSDDEEFGDDVEFEHEEMSDSEGDETSDSDELLNIPDEEMQLDEMDADTVDRCMMNAENDCEGNACSMSDGAISASLLFAEQGLNNNPPSVLSLNLNSYPPVSPLVNPNSSAMAKKFDFGPFAASDGKKVHVLQKHVPEHLSPRCSDGNLPSKPRKRERTSDDKDVDY